MCACLLLLYLGYEVDSGTLVCSGALGFVAFWLTCCVIDSPNEAATGVPSLWINIFLYIRLLVSVLLLFLSVPQAFSTSTPLETAPGEVDLHTTASERITLPFLISILGFFSYNLSWVSNPIFTQPMDESQSFMSGFYSEMIYLLHLMSNLGILSLCDAYAFDPRWFGSTIPGKWCIELIVLTFILFNFGFSLDYAQKNPKYIYGINFYVIYRLAMGVFLAFCSIPFKNPILCWIGFLVLGIYLTLTLALGNPDCRKSYSPMLSPFLVSAVLVVVASLFNYHSFFGCGIILLVYCLHFVIKKYFAVAFCMIMLMVGLALVLDSVVLAGVVGIAGLMLFTYMARKKLHRALFPVALLFLGSVMLWIGWKYQSTYQGVLRQTIVSFFIHIFDDFPKAGDLSSSWPMTDLMSATLPTQFNARHVPFFLSLPLWPIHVVSILLKSPKWVLPCTPIVLALATWLYNLYTWYTAEEPLDFQSTPAVVLKNWEIQLPSDTNNQGFLFVFEGEKPPSLVPSKVSVYIHDSPAVIQTYHECFGPETSTPSKKPRKNNTVREIFGKSKKISEGSGDGTNNEVQGNVIDEIGPFKLIPKRMPRNCFENGKSTVNGMVQIGTGYNEERPVDRDKMRSFLRKLIAQNNNPRATITFIYQSNTYTPKRGVLFSINVQASELLNRTQNGGPFLEQLAKWK